MDVICQGLTKIYPDGKEALLDLDLHIQEGLFGLLGPNGAGKTTLMEILTLLLEPTRGQVWIDGCDIRKHPDQIRSQVGYLPQFFGFFPELKAVEFLEYLGGLRGLRGRELKRHVNELLAQVRLGGVAHKRLKTFSGGMLRRVGIAQALLGHPKLIIVDEPTAGLDPEERVHFRNLLFELGQGRVVILSTHIVKDVEETCNQLALLHEGRLRFQGSPTAFIRAVQGKTWEFFGSHDEVEHFASRPNLVSICEKMNGICFRVVSPTPPRDNARPVMPNLEDAYVHFLETVRQAA
ncbi:MAG TPA: ABC transporter ATP-binding protein [bacterium]|nr:ABC transporter ATP-binding protein [Candidatus Omnitrophota bacterium]HOJ61906.1 ABC transporter ATP-binding protein [bacterium]HOL95439.1 ABC transporter ATP-binding protein [bacterium]HPP01122.1 ABC transporter ATP-binding protein [bacterium]HXK93561.1 ABC transporter ATP-binding protein [bacterium]